MSKILEISNEHLRSVGTRGLEKLECFYGMSLEEAIQEIWEVGARFMVRVVWSGCEFCIYQWQT